MTRTPNHRCLLALVVPLLLVVTSQSFVIQPPLPVIGVSTKSQSCRSRSRHPRAMISRPDVEETKNDPSTIQSEENSDPFSLATPNDKAVLLTTTSLEGTEQEGDGEMSLFVARAILLLVAAIWGTNFASVKYLENLCFHPPCHHPPSEFALARFGVAGLVSIPLLVKQRWDVILGGFECGLWITLGYVSQAMALATISSGKCAFICSLTVVFVPVVSAILYGRPIKRADVLAGLVAISGVAILEGLIDINNVLGAAPAVADSSEILAQTTAASSSTVEVATDPVASLAATIGIDKGSLLALGQPVGFGFAFTRIEATQEKFKDVPNRVLTIAAAQCVSVGILSLLWVLYDYDGVLPDFGYLIEWHRIATIVWTGIVTTVFAIYLEGIALQKATATDASIAFSSEPVWASMFGYLLLSENLGLNAYVGGAVIMTGCLIGALSEGSPHMHEKDLSP